jgi:biopolymer transport protein ExbD
MAMGIQDEDEEITDINVTPLVDVMLVLLVIFMVTATYIVHKSIQVKLPKAATAQDATSSKNLAFVLNSDSNLFLDGEEITYDQIPAKLNQIKSNLGNETNLQALISADEKTPHGKVVKLLDTIRKNGINDFAINVEVDYSETKESTQ